MYKKINFPNFYKIFELKHYSPNKIRVEVEAVRNNKELSNFLKENILKIDGIYEIKVFPSLANISVKFDESKISPEIMLGVLVKLCGLEDKILEKKDSEVKIFLSNVLTSLNISVYNKSKGLLDMKSVMAGIFILFAFKRIKQNAIFPNALTLFWWAYNLTNK